MHIAILGTGSVATALGTAFTAAEHDVTYGSRTPGDAPGVRSHADAIRDADVVVTALPGQAVVPTLEEAGTPLDGKVVLDVSNAFTPQYTLEHPNDSVARRVQDRFPTSRVVKSLSTMNTSVMTDPAAAPGSTVFVCGNDADAKGLVGSLLADLGWTAEQVLDLGDVAAATGVESYGLLFLHLLTALQTPTFNIAVVRGGEQVTGEVSR